MNLSINPFSKVAITSFKDQAFPSLTFQQKKIAIIVAVVFSAIAALYVLIKCCWKSNPGVQIKPSNPPEAPKKVDENKHAVEPKKTKELKQAEEPKKEPKKMEQPKKAEEQEKAEELKKSEEQKKAEELKKAKEQEKAEEKKKAKEQEKAEEQKKAEELKKAEEQKAREQEKAEELKKAEEIRKAEELKKAEEIAAADRKAQKIMNVLIVGRTRSGKSTLMEVLTDPFHITPPMTMFRGTALPKEKDIDLKIHTKGSGADAKAYKLRVLDTPGLFEQEAKENIARKRDNQELARIIKEKAIEVFGGDGYGNVDSVIFTASIDDGIMEDDVESIKYFLEKELPSGGKKFFVITRSERLLPDEFDSLREQLSMHGPLADHIEKDFGGKDKILFSGALSDQVVDEESWDPQRAQRLLKNIASMRENFIQALLSESVTEEERQQLVEHDRQEFEVHLLKFIADRASLV